MQKTTFCPISLSGSNFNPQNTYSIPADKIIAFLERDQKLTFCVSIETHTFLVRSCNS
jgi:hypothetical protein